MIYLTYLLYYCCLYGHHGGMYIHSVIVGVRYYVVIVVYC